MAHLMIRTRPSRNVHQTHWGFRQPLFRDFNRLFTEMVNAVEIEENGTASPEGEVLLRPRLDITETDTVWSLTAEVPGVPTEAMSVTIRDDILEISGAPVAHDGETAASHHLSERRPGRFFRKLKLPKDVLDTKLSSAIHHNGLLTLTIPKRVKLPDDILSIPVTQGPVDSEG